MVQVLQRRGEHSGWQLEVDNDQLRAIIKANPLTTMWEVVEELNVNHPIVIWHLKQIRKVKKLCKWVPHELTANQKKTVVLSMSSLTVHKFSYCTQEQQTISQLDCDIRQKVDCMTTSNDQLSRRTEKKLQDTFKSQTGTKKRSWFLVVCFQFEALQLLESQRNHYIWEVCSANRWDVPKLQCLPPALVNKKGPILHSNAWLRNRITNSSKVE